MFHPSRWNIYYSKDESRRIMKEYKTYYLTEENRYIYTCFTDPSKSFDGYICGNTICLTKLSKESFDNEYKSAKCPFCGSINVLSGDLT